MKTADKLKNSTATEMHDVGYAFGENVDGLFVKKEQHIPDEFIRKCKFERMNSLSVKEGENMKIASVPVAVVEEWLTQGFDIYKESAKAIMKRLQAQNLDAFITTNKKF